MTNLVALRALNAGRWARCTILPKRQAEVDAVARKLCAPDAKLRYQAFHKPYGASRTSGSALPSFMSGKPMDHRIGTNNLDKAILSTRFRVTGRRVAVLFSAILATLRETMPSTAAL
jgi:hypothetical protein